MLVQKHQTNSPIKLVLMIKWQCSYAIDYNQWNYNKNLQVHYSLGFKPEERLGKMHRPHLQCLSNTLMGFKYPHILRFPQHTKAFTNVCSWVQCLNPLGLQWLCAFIYQVRNFAYLHHPYLADAMPILKILNSHIHTCTLIWFK